MALESGSGSDEIGSHLSLGRYHGGGQGQALEFGSYSCGPELVPAKDDDGLHLDLERYEPEVGLEAAGHCLGSELCLGSGCCHSGRAFVVPSRPISFEDDERAGSRIFLESGLLVDPFSGLKAHPANENQQQLPRPRFTRPAR